MRTALTLALLTLLLIPIAQAASISGTVYNYDLIPVHGAVLTINTTPEQLLVIPTGTYTLTVQPGHYLLTVGQAKQHGITEEDQQVITITDENEYTLDFILFPKLTEEEDLEIDEAVIAEEQPRINITYLIIGIILVIAGSIGFATAKKKTQPTNDELETALIQHLKTRGTSTQKELRAATPYSEAKVSMAITSLEAQGKIIKIKKGRSNIIKLQK